MYQDLESFKLKPGQRGRSSLVVQLWWLVQSTLFRCSPQFLYGWRRFLLRLFGAKVGKGVVIRSTARVTYPWKLTIGDYAWIGDDVELYNWSEIFIGTNAVVSQRSYLCTGSHDYSVSSFDLISQPITISEQAWVATDVFIAPGITVGRAAIVGARSSVFKDVPENMISVGSPAVPVKPRPSNV